MISLITDGMLTPIFRQLPYVYPPEGGAGHGHLAPIAPDMAMAQIPHPAPPEAMATGISPIQPPVPQGSATQEKPPIPVGGAIGRTKPPTPEGGQGY